MRPHGLQLLLCSLIGSVGRFSCFCSQPGVCARRYPANLTSVSLQDEEMPEGLTMCTHIWKEDRSKACPYQYSNAEY